MKHIGPCPGSREGWAWKVREVCSQALWASSHRPEGPAASMGPLGGFADSLPATPGWQTAAGKGGVQGTGECFEGCHPTFMLTFLFAFSLLPGNPDR